jgi:hypothetical protein
MLFHGTCGRILDRGRRRQQGGNSAFQTFDTMKMVEQSSGQAKENRRRAFFPARLLWRNFEAQLRNLDPGSSETVVIEDYVAFTRL